MIGLADLPDGPIWSKANAINDFDQVAGANFSQVAIEAFQWEPRLGIIGLGFLPAGQGWSVALDVNNAGQVVGESGSAEHLFEGFVWDPLNAMRDPGELPDASHASSATDINELGQITGIAYTLDGSQPFLWDPQNGLEILSPCDGDAARGYALNDHGQVVGEAVCAALLHEEAIVGHVEHGLRAREVRSLTPESFDVDFSPATVTVKAGYSKHRPDDTLPLRPGFATELRLFLASGDRCQPDFGALPKKTARMLRADLDEAGIPYRDGHARIE